MSEEAKSNPDTDSADAQNPEANGRIAALMNWAKASRLRMALVGTTGVFLLGCIFASWSYLAHLAVHREFPVSLGMAMYALDVGEYDKAKSTVAQLQKRGELKDEFGGALFVLGAIKAYQADSEWSLERKRAMYLLAARYLRKSLSLGVPEDRYLQAKYLLGMSLVRGNQPEPGIKELLSIIDGEGVLPKDVHELLSIAYQALATPDLEAALGHTKKLLEVETLEDSERANALVTEAELLGKLGRLEEANQELKTAEKFTRDKSRLKSVAGKLALQASLTYPSGSEKRNTLIDQAIASLTEAKGTDPLNSELARQCLYWLGRCHQARGDVTTAVSTFDRLSKQHGDSPESLAGTLQRAILDQAAGNSEKALAGYRLVLETVGDPVTYVNHLLPLVELRKRLEQAQREFVRAGQFKNSMVLVDQFFPVFSLIEISELRGKAHEQWGEKLLEEASGLRAVEAEQLRKEGRYHLRAAGAAYESLAKLRFASREFTTDLWNAAENYFHGHSFTHAERVLNEFLHHEAELQQALALLRLGQSQLALRKPREAANTLEECMELHPRDAVIFQARLECFNAYLETERKEEAKQLLVKNLRGDNLLTTSTEWRDSLFALGSYYHENGEYSEAIKILDEAVRRYPEADQSLMARYTIARSYHNASKKPAEIAQTAKTESERQKNRKLRDWNLEQALENYADVQRRISIEGHGDHGELENVLLKNCYMMQGSVLFQLKRYSEARKAYSNISTLYVNEPFVLESFVHIANCWRRLNQPIKAKGTLEQAKLVLQRFPPETDFLLATNFNRDQWTLLLDEMSQW